jgi:hypothetical protein
MKSLYFLHIPKTGGAGFRHLGDILRENGLTAFIGADKEFTQFSDYTYIQGHFGTYVLEKDQDIDYAVVLRDPVDRMISQFAWGMMVGLYSGFVDGYESGDGSELLRKFLFYDERIFLNNNLQTRFLSNPQDEGAFYCRHISGIMPDGSPVQMNLEHADKPYNAMVIEWSMSNMNTSIENAKSTIDKATILGTLDSHDKFVSDICNWVKENYNIDIEDEFKNRLATNGRDFEYGSEGAPNYNYSYFVDPNGKSWTTSELKNTLTEEEIAKVYENNSMDLEIYNYVKDKIK